MPDLVRYQLRNGPHAGEPTTERGEIERLALECKAANCVAGLDSTVVETRFNVVRSLVPDIARMARRLRDYLPPVDQHDAPAWADRVTLVIADGSARPYPRHLVQEADMNRFQTFGVAEAHCTVLGLTTVPSIGAQARPRLCLGRAILRGRRSSKLGDIPCT